MYLKHLFQYDESSNIQQPRSNRGCYPGCGALIRFYIIFFPFSVPLPLSRLMISVLTLSNVTLSAPSSTDRSFQPALSVTIVFFVVTALPCQAGLKFSIVSWGQNRFWEVLPSFLNSYIYIYIYLIWGHLLWVYIVPVFSNTAKQMKITKLN